MGGPAADICDGSPDVDLVYLDHFGLAPELTNIAGDTDNGGRRNYESGVKITSD